MQLKQKEKFPLYNQPDACILHDAEYIQMVEAVQELCQHGFGRVEVTIQDGKIMIIQATKTYRPLHS